MTCPTLPLDPAGVEAAAAVLRTDDTGYGADAPPDAALRVATAMCGAYLAAAGERETPAKALAAPEGFPPVGSMVLVAGANSDLRDGSEERAYNECMVIGYTPCGLFVCFQTPGCWPYVERLANCHFRPLPAPPAATGEG